MGIGGSILLIALGAILAFAVEYELGWLDLSVVGWVLMIAGVAGLIMTTLFWQRSRRTVVAGQTADPRVPYQDERGVPVEDGRVVQEYREVRRPNQY